MSALTPDLDPPLTFGGWLRHDTVVEALSGLPADGRIATGPWRSPSADDAAPSPGP